MSEKVSLPPDLNPPRLCYVCKWPEFQGYGFHLHAEKGKPGQFIGDVDDFSPARYGGLEPGHRIVAVNGTNVSNENHQQVVQRIKLSGDEVCVLVVDKPTDIWCRENKVIINEERFDCEIAETPLNIPDEVRTALRLQGMSVGEEPVEDMERTAVAVVNGQPNHASPSPTSSPKRQDASPNHQDYSATVPVQGFFENTSHPSVEYRYTDSQHYEPEEPLLSEKASPKQEAVSPNSLLSKFTPVSRHDDVPYIDERPHEDHHHDMSHSDGAGSGLLVIGQLSEPDSRNRQQNIHHNSQARKTTGAVVDMRQEEPPGVRMHVRIESRSSKSPEGKRSTHTHRVEHRISKASSTSSGSEIIIGHSQPHVESVHISPKRENVSSTVLTQIDGNVYNSYAHKALNSSSSPMIMNQSSAAAVERERSVSPPRPLSSEMQQTSATAIPNDTPVRAVSPQSPPAKTTTQATKARADKPDPLGIDGVSAKEMRERLKMKKKKDIRDSKISSKDKHKMIEGL